VIDQDRSCGTVAAQWRINPFGTLERIATMKDLHPTVLTTVLGGTAKTDQITQQLTTLTGTLKDAVSANANGSGNNNQFMMIAMMMAMRPHEPTVIAAGGPGPVAAASGPMVNIRTRVR
jgi:hypothetical protein